MCLHMLPLVDSHSLGSLVLKTAMEPELRFKGLPRHDKAGVSRVHEHLEVNHLQQRSRSYCENGQLGEDMHLLSFKSISFGFVRLFDTWWRQICSSSYIFLVRTSPCNAPV